MEPNPYEIIERMLRNMAIIAILALVLYMLALFLWSH